MSYYLAPSLVALRDEINARWPNRDKASDGWIGDTSHSARKSDHNPDWSAGGVVRAIDIDKDGIDTQAVLDATIGDHRVWYVIFNRRIYSRTYGWAARTYTGSNPHDKHIHVSIAHTRAAETDRSPWLRPAPEESFMATDKAEQMLQRILAQGEAAKRRDVHLREKIIKPLVESLPELLENASAKRRVTKSKNEILAAIEELKTMDEPE